MITNRRIKCPRHSHPLQLFWNHSTYHHVCSECDFKWGPSFNSIKMLFIHYSDKRARNKCLCFNTCAHPQKSLFIQEFWPCVCCNLHVEFAGGCRGSALHICSPWAHSCSYTQDFSRRNECQVASLWPWETGPLYTPSDCFQYIHRLQPSCLITEFHFWKLCTECHFFFLADWILAKTFIHILRFRCYLLLAYT